jgi:hypothetical protein
VSEDLIRNIRVDELSDEQRDFIQEHVFSSFQRESTSTNLRLNEVFIPLEQKAYVIGIRDEDRIVCEFISTQSKDLQIQFLRRRAYFLMTISLVLAGMALIAVCGR